MLSRLTPKGDRFSALTVEVFRTRALMLQGAESLAQSVGLTSAKWQILGMLANGPATVASVARMVGLTRQMAVDFGPDGIRVNAICPGHIVTERIQARWDANPSGFRFFERQYPLRRCGTPLDVANAIVFLCSAEASFITGHALVVDGGLTVQFQEDLAVALGRYIQEHPDTQFPF